MKNNKNSHSEGLKCDEKGCGYADWTIKSEDYHKHVNHPCPKCGSNLLTQADYDTFIAMEKVLNHPVLIWINKIFNILTLGLFSGIRTEVIFNGSGKISYGKTGKQKKPSTPNVDNDLNQNNRK